MNPDRQAYVQTVPFNPHIVHGVKGQEVEDLEEITIEVSALLDEKFAAYSVDFIKEMAESDKPSSFTTARGGVLQELSQSQVQGQVAGQVSLYGYLAGDLPLYFGLG